MADEITINVAGRWVYVNGIALGEECRTKDDAAILADALRSTFINSGRYVLLERGLPTKVSRATKPDPLDPTAVSRHAQVTINIGFDEPMDMATLYSRLTAAIKHVDHPNGLQGFTISTRAVL